MTLPAGIYCPIVSFFEPTLDQQLDIPTHVRHVQFLGRAGVQGVVVQGSTGEAVALSSEEKKTLIKSAKDALEEIGSQALVIAGTVGAQSTRQAIELSRDASQAGADYVLVLPPSFYPAAMNPDSILGFYNELASASPIPVIVYSYPGVCSGINMDSDLLIRIAAHPNVHGVKHTDHDVGRMARMVRAREQLAPFTVLGGATDYLLGAAAYGVQGAITGSANVAPRVCIKVFGLASTGRIEEAKTLALEISRAEWALGKGNILGTKYATVYANGYPGTAALCRRPLPVVSDATRQHVEQECSDIIALERQLEKEGYDGRLKSRTNGKTNGHA
ncbi:aldolase [Karstenula rhodostoma CBS 690.94]|uniref:Aldolase n=1 Tax=Karstenula rhodostoma CBS 690.94 TaxID=1392251 RepID=A0A9P4UFL3_9PLEO|nr:aldolase [Karstenula rhodostoma CBS 690.94]